MPPHQEPTVDGGNDVAKNPLHAAFTGSLLLDPTNVGKGTAYALEEGVTECQTITNLMRRSWLRIMFGIHLSSLRGKGPMPETCTLV